MLDNDELAQYYFNWMSDYKEWARLWKQAAKKWRHKHFVEDCAHAHTAQYTKEYHDDASRRLELLRECEKHLVAIANIENEGLKKLLVELAKELGDG